MSKRSGRFRIMCVLKKKKNFSDDSPCICPRRSHSKSFALEHRLSSIEILSPGIRRNKISTLSSSPLQITECYRSTDYYEFRCHCWPRTRCLTGQVKLSYLSDASGIDSLVSEHLRSSGSLESCQWIFNGLPRNYKLQDIAGRRFAACHVSSPAILQWNASRISHALSCTPVRVCLF